MPTLAAAGADGYINIFTLLNNNWQHTARFFAHPNGCNSVSWASDVNTGSLLTPANKTVNNTNADTSVRRLVSGGCDNCVRMWSNEAKNENQQQNQWTEVKFIDNNKCFIAGSVWSRDIKIIKESIINSNIKSIVAPHEVSQKQINELENIFGNSCVKLSCLKEEEDFQKKVLIVDSIGQLRYMYKYANFCYVGGGFSKNSLHNILEPSVFSCPVIIGNLYYGFKEAEDLIELGGVLSIKNSIEFSQVFSELCLGEEKEKKLGKINLDYVYENEKNNRKVIDSLIKTLQ